MAYTKGAAWNSGLATSCTACRGTNGATGRSRSTVAGAAARTTFGRPVLPLDVGAFHDEATASGSGRGSPSTSPSRPSTTRAGPVRSRTACRSATSSVGANG